VLKINRGDCDIMTTKKEKWDGRSRPSDDNYRKNFNRIFHKKEKTLHEAMMEGYEEEKKMYEQQEKEEQANIQSDNLEMEKLNGRTKKTN